MIPRTLTSELVAQLHEFPVVTILGPRQAGKTTLVRTALPEYDYVTLEDPDTRAIVREDPKAFLKRHDRRVIFDEIQRAPHLLSYLQGIVDERQENGQFVLTGSHQLELRAAITQSLAGRTGMLHLLPLSIAELAGAGISFEFFEEYVFRGFLPRIYDQNQRPRIAYGAYYQTYVERDVRQLIRLKDATLFEKFIKLLAGRAGQVVNYQSLAGDVGVDTKTIKQWLSILEASFIVFRLAPYYENFGKRAIKSPKIYFTDTGLLAYLLDIENVRQVTRDPLVGNLFENLVVLEAVKARVNRAQVPNLYFFRDNHGNEIDLLHKSGNELVGIEIKSAATYHASFKKSLRNFSERISPLARRYIAYSGEPMEFSDGITAIPYTRMADIL
ncbi:ATP-binding protein [Microbulbifer sp.]|uniref:ATP-binding protein n=1 Tax=Microbulbifer sp. TaxID=1908541 RepID=UPI003F3C3B78